MRGTGGRVKIGVVSNVVYCLVFSVHMLYSLPIGVFIFLIFIHKSRCDIIFLREY